MPTLTFFFSLSLSLSFWRRTKRLAVSLRIAELGRNPVERIVSRAKPVFYLLNARTVCFLSNNRSACSATGIGPPLVTRYHSMNCWSSNRRVRLRKLAWTCSTAKLHASLFLFFFQITRNRRSRVIQSSIVICFNHLASTSFATERERSASLWRVDTKSILLAACDRWLRFLFPKLRNEVYYPRLSVVRIIVGCFSILWKPPRASRWRWQCKIYCDLRDLTR